MENAADTSKNNAIQVDRDFLNSQITNIQRATFKRIKYLSGSLVVALSILYIVVYHSITWFITASHVADILSPSTQKELKELYQEANLEVSASEIFFPETITKVKNYILSINQDMSNDQIKQMLDIAPNAYGDDTISMRLILKNSIDRERLSSQISAPNANKYFRFSFGRSEEIPDTYFNLKLTEYPDSELEGKLRDRLMLKQSEVLTTKNISSNFNKIKDLFEKYVYTDRVFLNVKSVLKNRSEILQASLDANTNNMKLVHERIKSIIDSERDNVKSYLGANMGVHPYFAFVSRSLFSLVLVTICIMLLMLIKGEIAVVAKTQSLAILAGGLNFKAEGVSLFDAVDRLHSSGVISHDVKDISTLFNMLQERRSLLK